MALKSGTPVNLSALRQDYSALPQIAAVKAQANQQMIGAIQSGLQKRKERIEKKEKNALNEKILKDLIASDPNNTIVPAGMDEKELAKIITLPESLAYRRALVASDKAAAQLEQIGQGDIFAVNQLIGDKKLTAEEQKKISAALLANPGMATKTFFDRLRTQPSSQVSSENIADLAKKGAELTKIDEATLLALGKANPNSLSTLVSNVASRKEETDNLTGPAAQYDRAFELLSSDDAKKVEQGELLLQDLKDTNLSPKEKSDQAFDVAKATAEGRASGEKEAGMQQARQAAARQIIVLEDKINLAKNVLSSVTDDSLGLSQQILKFIPGTEQADFDANVETIQSFIALDGMLNLKKSSPTGSTGFGSLSEKELKTLQDRIRSLSTMQSPAQFRDALSEVIESFELSKSLLQLEYLGWSDDEEVMAKRIKASGLSKQAARAVYIAQGVMPPETYFEDGDNFNEILQRNLPDNK